MCETCGCSDSDEKFWITKPGEWQLDDKVDNLNEQVHYFRPLNNHSHLKHSHSISIELNENILQKNNLLAARNRGYFAARNITVINIVSSPGAGKTSLLEKSIRKISELKSVFVIEGDQQTTLDAERILKAGASSIQINTGNGCHLDAEMIYKAVISLNPPENSLLIIENVGNLVCPALFDLGEHARVLIASVTEGDDKPLKYPNVFVTSRLCILNKMDLLPYVDFKVDNFTSNALRINHHLEIMNLSVKSGEGLNEWFEWIGKL